MLAEYLHVGADLVELGSVAVEFGLVQPVVAGGNCLGGDGAAGLDETEGRDHAQVVDKCKGLRHTRWAPWPSSDHHYRPAPGMPNLP